MALDGGAVKRPLVFHPGCNTPEEVTRANVLSNIRRDLPWLDKRDANDKTLAIVAGGPSLTDRWPEIMACDSVLSLNNSYGFLVERGIVPDYWMLLDARVQNVDFLRLKQADTTHFVAAQCAPKIFDELSGFQTVLYLTILPGTSEAIVGIDKPKHLLAGYVGTVGIKALCLAYALGYRKFRLFGYDSSYRDDVHHAFPQPMNDESRKVEVFLGEKRYITTATLAHQATEFSGFASELVKNFGCDIELSCSGLLPDMVAAANAESQRPLEDREREKYQQIWSRPEYRKHAPGEHFVEAAVSHLGMSPGDSVIDFGCGTGRGAQRLAENGFRVTGVDFADNCRDPGCTFAFVQACLWDLPDTLSADWGYCTDVMEHIPRERVLDVLGGIAKRTKGAFFNISTTEDHCGSLIGRKLHMTVMGDDAWKGLMEKFWKSVKMFPSSGEVVFVCEQPV